MGRGSRAEMLIDGNDNKAVIIQRGGTGDVSQESALEQNEDGGGHFADQDIYGDWNRMFVTQTGRTHVNQEYVSYNFV